LDSAIAAGAAGCAGAVVAGLAAPFLCGVTSSLHAASVAAASAAAISVYFIRSSPVLGLGRVASNEAHFTACM
jgi:hypothetical protein